MGENLNNSLFEDNCELFYLESDHLALKGNHDYSELLKAIIQLEIQYSKAIKDYEKVIGIQNEALSDPNSFHRKLINKEHFDIPDMQVIVELPHIDWSKYPVEQLPNEVIQFLKSEPVEEKLIPESPIKPDTEKKSDSAKKKTWSVEEQRRLEELLVIYPPEPIELRRYKKIATALGNRTVKQVSSRVQKYFLKLYKAGLPIPGRIPKNAEKAKKSKLHTHQRFNHLLFKPTTFFPQLDIPVVMNEGEVVPGPSTDVASSSNTELNNYLLPSTLENLKPALPVEDTKTHIELQIELLRRIKLEKEKGSCSNNSVQHIGYKCNYCAEKPIHGARWHCENCTLESIDFCSDCVIGQMYSAKPHPLSHQLQPYSEDAKLESDSSDESTSKEEADDFSKNYSSSDGSSNSNGNNSTENEDSNFNEAFNTTNAFTKFRKYEQEDNIDINEPAQLFDFEQNIGDDLVTPHAATDEKDWCYINQYSKGFSYSECDLDKQDNFITDNRDSFADVPNLSYSYLHSNLFDEN